MYAIMGLLGTFLTLIVFPIMLLVLLFKVVRKTSTKKDKTRPFICLAIGVALVVIAVNTTPDDAEKKETQEITEETSEVAETAEKTVEEEKPQEVIEEKEEEPVKKKEDKEENSKSFEYADMTVEFIEYSIEENAVGEKCLVLYFDFTNDRDESQAFGYTFTVKAFQDGVELEPTYFQVNKETENSTKEIKPGVTLRVAEQYGIEDVSGTINVEIEPFNIWSDKVLLDYEFSLDE
jgi:hypothetical protein